MIKKVSFAEAKRLLDELPERVLLDVREEEEYITGHAVDAVLLPVDTLNDETAMEAIPTLETPVLVYCRSGFRSAVAALKLDELGYETIYDIGGLVGWPYGLV
ncbi:MAG: rhodanese-like domain-containing protein [Oscillospiraceae bacterium]|nr:rhodanese-like domain-containing protein [Oscillospiraceae bacterium]